jgi:hypothetical protein
MKHIELEYKKMHLKIFFLSVLSDNMTEFVDINARRKMDLTMK